MARTTTKSGKREMNPTDAYRKLQRKKEVQKNKKERKKVRDFSAMVRNPDLMVEEVSEPSLRDSIATFYCVHYSSLFLHMLPVFLT